MEKHDYREEMREDILNYIKENNITIPKDEIDDIYEKLYDEMFISDAITGNASGSYTFNTWTAEENLCHNFDLLQDALTEFCSPLSILDSAESCDVSIRCYLLGEVLTEVLNSITEEEEF